MPQSNIRLADQSLRCLGKLEPASLASWEALAPALRALDHVGFQSIEAWGDLTFDRCMAALRESPWERIARLAHHITRTPLQMELRGRCLLGSRPFGPDVTKVFVERAVDCGVRSFLVYEPLNDLGGLEELAGAVRDAGARLTLGLVYDPSHPEGEAAHVGLGTRLAEMGASAVCLKTAEGVAPSSLAAVVAALASALSVPVEVALDSAGGLGPVAALECVRAGASVVYGSAAPSWLDPSSVPHSVLAPLLSDTAVDIGIDPAALAAAGTEFGESAHAGDMLASVPSMLHDAALVDMRDLMRVPADVVWQVGERLRTLQASGRLREVITEIGRVRSEVGDPALVPPIAQIVATQAVLNVIYQKRWQLVPDEMRAFLRGAYGSSARPASVRLPQIDLDGAPPKEHSRASGPTLEELAGEVGELARGTDDLLMFALAPSAAMVFLEKRRAAADVEALFDPVESSNVVSELQDQWHDLGPDRVGELVELLEASTVDELVIENQGTRICLKKGGQTAPVAAPPASMAPLMDTGAASVSGESDDDSQATVVASMVGTFYRSAAPGVPPYVEVGSEVKKGEPLCVLEAMKLMNEQLSEVDGEVVAVLVEDGSAVEYGQPLFLIRLAID